MSNPTPVDIENIPASNQDFGSSSAVLKKAIAPTTRKERVANVRPCEFKDTGEIDQPGDPIKNPLLSYTTHDGKLKHRPCTDSLFRAIEQGRLDMISDCDFLIHFDPASAKAVRVEPIKVIDTSKLGGVPSDILENKHIGYIVDKASGFVSFADYPPNVTQARVLEIKAALEALSEIKVGTQLPGGCRVANIQETLQGPKVLVLPPGPQRG